MSALQKLTTLSIPVFGNAVQETCMNSFPKYIYFTKNASRGIDFSTGTSLSNITLK